MCYLKIVIYTITVSLSFVHCQFDLPTQPTWLADNKAAKDFATKVEVNLKNILETASLRSEIEAAVHQHKYAVGGKDEEEIVHEADRELGKEYRDSASILGMSADPLAELDLRSNEEKHADAFDIVPNKISSSLFDDNNNQADEDGVFIPEYNADKYKMDTDSREMLQLNLIEEDLDFNVSADISMWKNVGKGLLLGSTGDRVVFVGILNGSYQAIKELSFGENIESIETVTQWNATDRTMSTFAILSAGNAIHWINTERKAEVWNWKIGVSVLDLKPFKFNKLRYLAILIHARIIIYQYNVKSLEYVAVQSIRLQDTVQQMVQLDVGYHILLAIPQNNSIMILQTESTTKDTISFKPMQSLPAENITTIEGFQMGGYAYLAVGGKQPKIYRYHYGNFRAQTILQKNFGIVDLFLPIPVRTYRDDMILLVQHTIEFESHRLTVVEPLIWNGEAFETTKSVPCKIGPTVDLFGASCILDMERAKGISGSAASVSLQGDVFVVVPRYDAPSGRFKLNTQLVSRRSEIDDLEVILKHIKNMVDDQEKALDMLTESNWLIDELQVNELIVDVDSEVGSLQLNNEDWEDTEQFINLDSLLDIMETNGKDLESTSDELTVERAFIEDLHVENWTDVKINKPKELTYDGSIIFEGNVVVENLIIEQPLMQAQPQPRELDLLEIEGDLEFQSINGIDWAEFTQQIVFKDTPTLLDDVQVTVKVVVDGDLTTNSINLFKFPDDFLLSSGPQYSEIFAMKNFTKMLSTNAMDCNGTINNIEPVNYITLDHQQEINGTTTISELEVTESFEINGTIAGKNIENFITNPTLLDTHQTKSECQFKNLEVYGPVAITGSLNQKRFEDILSDIVLISDTDIIVRAKKNFSNVQFDHPIELESPKINGIPIDEFVTKSGEQQLSIGEIEGSLTIENLQLDGLYNFINVTELELNSIKLNKDAIIDADLAFSDASVLEAHSVEVLHSVDNIPLENFFNIHEPLRFKRAAFDQLVVEEMNSTCQIEGSGKINGINLDQFNKERLSISEDQIIESDFVVNQIEIDTDFKTSLINGYPADQLFHSTKKSSNIVDSLRSATHVKVIGQVEINTLNGVDMKQLWNKVIWLNRPNTITGQIHFVDSIHLEEDLDIESDTLNGRSIKSFFDDLVLKKSDTSQLAITGPKRFISSIRAIQNAKIEVFNDIPYNLLATKINPLKIEGNLHVDGNLVIHSLDMEGEEFADLPIQKIFETYKYDPVLDMHYLNTEMSFSGHTIVDQLHIDGRINGFEGPRDVFSKLVYKSASFKMAGKKIFENRVSFQQGAEIDKLNGLDLRDFFKRVVYVNDFEPVDITGKIIFRSTIQAESVQVAGDIVTSAISGCRLVDWIGESLRIDQPNEIKGPVYFSEGVLDGSHLQVTYLNHKSLADVVTLHTPQELKGDFRLSFAQLDGHAIILDGINGRDIAKERRNTLMTYGDQHITAPVVAQRLHILRSLETLKPINGRDLRQVATLHEDLQLQSSFSFKNIKVKKLYTSDLISGLNFTEWYTTSLKTGTAFDQSITGTWSVDEMNIQSSNVDIQASLIFRKDSEFLPALKNFQANLNDSCARIGTLKEQADLRTTFVKYLQKRFEIVLKRKVDSVHPIVYGKMFLILVNTECVSEVYNWDKRQGAFERVGKIETGIVERLEIQLDGTFITLAEWRPQYCAFYGSAHWKFDGKEVVLIGRPVQPSIQNHYQYRETLPDFNETVNLIVDRLISDLRSIQGDIMNNSAAPIVGSPAEHHTFRHSITKVAKSLWDGFKHLDNVQTIMHHARKVYHKLTDHEHHSNPHEEHGTYPNEEEDDSYHKKHEHDHDSNDDHHEHGYDPEDDHYRHHDDDDLDHHSKHDSNVGSSILSEFSTATEVKQPNHKITEYRTQSLLKAISTGFDQFVESTTTARASDMASDIAPYVDNLISTITTAIHLNPNVNQSILQNIKEFTDDPKITLQRYAEYSTNGQQPISNVVPTEGHREAIRLTVGGKKNRLQLVAVISPSDTTAIRLYHLDLSSVYQIIETSKPHSLTSFEIKYETILAFVENINVIRVMRYRGIQGFVEWSSFRPNDNIPVTQLTSMTLPGKWGVCRKFYLISTVWERMEFFEIVVGGICPLNISIDICNGWW